MTHVKKMPSKGIVSDEAGTMSATISINTVMARRRVTANDTLSPIVSKIVHNDKKEVALDVY